jgi:LPS export ABC transporter protein LptC
MSQWYSSLLVSPKEGIKIYNFWGQYVLIIAIICFFGCVNSIEDIDALNKKYDIKKDIGTNVKIIYSDSGNVKLMIEAPVLHRYNDYSEPKDIFPNGILITFMDENKNPMSWLKADYAERLVRNKTMVAKGNVKFYNANNDALRTAELKWDEATKMISTEKFVKITQPSRQDTIYGVGLVTDYQFNRMEITNKFKARISGGELLPD